MPTLISRPSTRCASIARGLAGLCAALLLTPWAAATPLRGFGEVETRPVAMPGASGLEFRCESPEKATVLLQKLGRDLAQSVTAVAAWQTIALGGQSVPVLVRPGLGAFLPVAKDRTVYAFVTAQTERLPEAFAAIVPQLAGARFFDPAFRYPKYLDKFSHYGIGSWYPSYWGDELTKGQPNAIDDHFAYARKHDLTVQPNSGGYQLRNLLPKLHEYDRPFHFAQWHEWSQSLARLCPEELTQPGDQFTSNPSYYGQLSLGAKRLTTYRDWSFQNTVREFKDDPNLVDWLEPHGEIGPFHDHYYWDYSENNRAQFIRWLQTQRKYTLATLGEAWRGSRKAFKSWDQVPIPMTYDFFGWQPDSVMADREWRLHTAKLEEGLKRGYQAETCDDRPWVTFQMPGGELPGMAWRADKMIWYRGTLTVSEKWLQAHRGKGPIYLNAITLVNSRGWRNPDRLWVNGQELGALFNAPGYQNSGQVEVTTVLRPGANSIVYAPPYGGYGLRGTFFLATQPLEKYPFRDPQRNARYADWHEYVSWTLCNEVAESCRAIRALDPDRPIKIHAAYDKDLMGRVMATYGGYGHNTGEGSFLRAWDRRLGYPRGIGASAEFGGSIVTEIGLKRWIGFFTFEGLTAFDNFHNIQAMMYSPAKNAWVDYMPYLKLANRREIKKPDIALLWSSRNNQLLPRNIPMIYDLGRGDLQSIGYSYCYLDELGLEDGLAKEYPVLWDCGSWLMSPETVARIKAYVEAGGTFVALQETGRHTFTHQDAWPISSLSGFNVREVRPMSGAVTILRDQPLFTRLVGKVFYNRGRCTDYSDYNFADKCMVLDPVVPEAQAIARYQDGTVAVGLRKLGKGRVIILGSPFWRDSYDEKGLWWPSADQCAFLEDLLAGVGLTPLATADTHDFWREHYVATNGSEEYLTLWNPYAEAKTATVEWRTVHPAAALVDPKNGSPIPGTITGNTVRLEKLTLASYETLIVATQPVRPPQGVLQDWFAQLARMWQPSAPGQIVPRPDLPLYAISVLEGVTSRVVSATDFAKLDMAALSAGNDPGAGWGTTLGFIRPENLKLKLAAGDKIAYRCPIVLPASWQAGDTYELRFKPDWREHLYVDAFVNGKPVLSVTKSGTKEVAVDISALLAFGKPNLLVFAAPATGFFGQIEVTRRPKPAETVEVTGTWQLQATEDSGLTALELPGTMQGLFAQKRDVVIPQAWKGSRVFIEIEPGDIRDYNSFAINDKMVLHPVAWYEPVTYMDITPWVRFGQPNTLTLLPMAAARKWEPGKMTINRITFQRVP